MSLKTKAPKRRVGYARVSTHAQDLTRQVKALKRAGCDPVFSDKASGKSMAGRPALADALAELDEGDELVIAEWDRATRSMWDGLQIIKAVIGAARLDQGSRPQLYRPRHPYGAGLHGDAVGARRGRALAHYHRTHEGRQVAREKGVKMGRKPKLNPHQAAKEARQRLARGERRASWRKYTP